jgi:tetratricopeptide (TPR) repeat protein
MRTLLFFFAILPLSAGQDPGAARSAASAFAHRGDWRSAESHQRQALAACHSCSPEDRAVLRAELAGYLTLGGFPEAAIPLWKQSLAELPADSRLGPISFLGLGVALHAAGRTRDAQAAWTQACHAPANDTLENAACRFNVAAARMDSGDVWSEMEELLPVLLTVNGPISRATVLIQTARAAHMAGRFSRALTLLDRADTVIVGELDEKHPFRAMVFHARAEIAAKLGDRKEAKLWRKKAARLPGKNGWDRGTVSIEELKGKPH